jgi:mannose-1-phosphate guanylyltransferase
MTERLGVDAVVLVGGKGTRLLPMTIHTAKPMLPTAGVPFLEHLLSRIRAAGITHVILSTSYRAETFTDYFGDGRSFGLDIEYVVEDVPLGTGGGIRNVAHLLRGDTAMVFNGDILSGVDLSDLLGTHSEQAADVTLHLVKVSDARAFGSVPTGPGGEVVMFLEKTETPPTDQINAGCYVFRRSILESIPAGRAISVERETFPGLLAAGSRIYGHVDSSYWLDLGTPAAFVRGSADLVTGFAPTGALPGPVGEALVLPGAVLAPDASVVGGSALGRDVVVGADTLVDGSVVFDKAVIEPGAQVIRSVVGEGARVGCRSVVCDAVIGDGARIGPGTELLAGIRVWPGVEIPAGALRFSPQLSA